jgi:hypothetical protein
MNGVRTGNLFLGAYASSARNIERPAYTSDIPEPPKVVLPTPVYPVYLLGPIYSANPTTLTIAASGTIWTYTVATNSVRSIAGSGTNLANASDVDGQGMNARFADMMFLQGRPDGTLFVSSRVRDIVRTVSPSGFVSKYMGTGVNQDYVPGTPFETATLRYPTATHLDKQTETLYIGNNRQIVLVTKSRAVSMISVATTVYTFGFGQFGLDSDKNIIAADSERHVIFKVTPSGTLTIIAGGDQVSGYTDSVTPTNARFNQPTSVVVDSQDNIIVYDAGNYRFRKITPAGVVTTLAGNGTNGRTDGTGTAATFDIQVAHALQLQVDPADNVWFPYATIRKITPAGVVSTVYRFN